MTGVEPRTSGIESDRSTNWATTTSKYYLRALTKFVLLSSSTTDLARLGSPSRWSSIKNEMKARISPSSKLLCLWQHPPPQKKLQKMHGNISSMFDNLLGWSGCLSPSTKELLVNLIKLGKLLPSDFQTSKTKLGADVINKFHCSTPT